jgi:uncharacterized protein YbjT (DUF2867 family)
MANQQSTVLIVGATGNLGHRIVDALLIRKEKPGVRVAVRGGDANKHGERLKAWQARGVEIVDADLADEPSLERATKGADIVISAVQGGPDVIVEGQGRLLAASRKTGVKRLVSSDYSFNHFALTEGENVNSDWRRAFDKTVMASGIGHTFFCNGGFMEVMMSPFIGLVDKAAGTLSFWGDGQTKIDLTSMDDGAAYLAASVLDPATLNRTVEIAGDELDMKGIAAAFEAATGQKLKVVSKGTIEAGYAELERLKREKVELIGLLPLMYQLPMVSGKAKLHHVENARYPDVKRTSLAVFLKFQAATPKATAA